MHYMIIYVLAPDCSQLLYIAWKFNKGIENFWFIKNVGHIANTSTDGWLTNRHIHILPNVHLVTS